MSDPAEGSPERKRPSAAAVFDPANLLATLPEAPGVYHMRDSDGRSLYVGKAINLRSRVSSYFRSRSGHTPKTIAMLRHVADVQITRTRTAGEALLLENNLIKEHRPRYNIYLRDDKSYPYIALFENHDFPRLAFYRGRRRVPGRLFGPFPGAGAVRETLTQLQKVFPVRQCEDTFYRNRSRPCLQYQMGRCTAPCVGYVSREAYAEDVRQAVLFLEGRSQRLQDELSARMESAAEKLDFEQAARWRDRITALQRVQQQQFVTAGEGDADVIAVDTDEGEVIVEVMFIRGGRNIGSRSYFLAMPLDYDPADVLDAFLPQFYLGRGKPPAEILLSDAISDADVVAAALGEQAGRRVRVSHRVRGHRAQWLAMARVNAAESLRRQVADHATRERRLLALAQALDLSAPPQRIECFDISHTMGEATVASCVVFDAEGPVKSDYRRFNISSTADGDDYAAMREVFARRYRASAHNETTGLVPDLVLIDGGKGQLKAAIEALDELGVSGLRLCAVSKGAARRPGQERLFLRGSQRATILRADSPALHLIQQIRDEAHRFAITGHRARRGRKRTTSALDAIAGVGDRRRQALLRQFGGLQQVARATVEDLARVPGISRELARRIHDHFNA